MLAHIRNGEFIRAYADGKGRVTLANGDTVSPPVAGYENGPDKIVPLVEETIDNSTGSVTTQSSWILVEADRVVRGTTITDRPIEDQRAAMRCSPAQMRLTLHRMGLLDQVQAIADADPEASIVWEYATAIERTSPFIDALGGPNGFTPEQIDDIFRAAMQV